MYKVLEKCNGSVEEIQYECFIRVMESSGELQERVSEYESIPIYLNVREC